MLASDHLVPVECQYPPHDAQALAAEITELCAYRYALDARFLALLRTFDAGRHWERLGFPSCAHWMNLKCSIGLNAAREKLRVAHALGNLPNISAAFAEGRLSYSKVRALTRIADAENEQGLLKFATHGTAWHVETLVRKYRGVLRAREAGQGDAAHQQRALNYHYDSDGMLVIRGRLPAEQGALVVKALEQAMDDADAEVEPADVEDHETTAIVRDAEDDVTAVTSLPVHARRADALVDLAEARLAGNTRGSSSADRFNVVVHVTAATSHIEHGPQVPAETSERLCCDGAVIALLEDAEGVPLSIGRKSRTIPPGLRRALLARDGGCRFPGCTHTRFVDGHHIQHWANGGETSLDNLLLLCRYHHRLVHEGGFSCEKTPSGEAIFKSPDNDRLWPYAPLPGLESGEDPIACVQRFVDPSLIDDTTCASQWYAGDDISWDLAVASLF